MRVGVIDGRSLLGYRQLLDRSQALAGRLCGVGAPGDPVGVRLECSAHTVVAYFACLRAGRCYTPLPASPAPGEEELIGRLGLVALITDRAAPSAVPRFHPAQDAASAVEFPGTDPGAAAHLLLTSGTSGVPKAVLTDQVGSLLSHRWRSELAPYRDDDVVGCNVFGVWDVVPALQHGVPVVMIPDAALRDPLALAGILMRHGITRLLLTPTLLGACLSSARAVAALRRVRLIVLCGETARPAMVRRALERLPDTRLLNLYSTSECHDVAAGTIDHPDDGLQPAPFAEIRLTDPSGGDRPVPAGEPGRLLVGGPGVALGYLDGKARGFCESGGGRWFDTGDLAVSDGQGRIRITGRADARAKVRGQWVEPAEVESALAGHPEVLDVVVAIEHGRVMARVVSGSADLAPRLRNHVRGRLPAHAVPARIEIVARLDVGPSGKAARSSAAPPPDELTGRILEAFREVLGQATVGADDDFADLGGDSIDAIELAGRLQALSGRAPNVGDILFYRTPRALAAHLSGTAQADEVRWRLPGAVAPRPLRGRRGDAVLLSGATGYLGSLLAERIGSNRTDLRRGALDLDEPDLGLAPAAFDHLAGRLGRIVHTAARMEPFGGFDDHYRTNVEGVLTLIRLAQQSGSPIDHVSSSAVLPLGTGGTWKPDRQPSEQLAGLLRASGADAYSYTKLGAELALWRAGASGLPVRIVRIAHLLGHPTRDRLIQTLLALRAAGVYPEGPWRWQFVLREPVADVILSAPPERPEIVHVALPPVPVADLVRYLALDLRPVPAAAVATALTRVDPEHPDAARAKVLAQLVAQYGPMAALSLNDAILSDLGGDPLAAFGAVFRPFG